METTIDLATWFLWRLGVLVLFLMGMYLLTWVSHVAANSHKKRRKRRRKTK